jgi:hypothetical protein
MASNSLCKYRLYKFFFPKKCNKEQVVVSQPSDLQPVQELAQPVQYTLQGVQQIANANMEKRKQMQSLNNANNLLDEINNTTSAYLPKDDVTKGYKLQYDTYTDENYPNKHIAVGGKSRRKRRRKTKIKRRGRRRTTKRKTKSQQRK